MNHKSQVELFNQHLRILEGKYDSFLDQQEILRLENIKKIPSKTLEFTQNIKRWHRFVTLRFAVTSLAAAATVAVVFGVGVNYDKLKTKGMSRVFVVVDQDQQRELWYEGMQLKNKAQVNAEIVADRPIVAFSMIYDQMGKLLTTEQQVRQSQLRVNTNESRHFAKGFQLIDQNVGETLAVILCEETAEVLRRVDKPKFFLDLQSQISINKGLASYKGCSLQAFKLR